ncbi:hypothetical protein Arno162_58 [Pectobacterium phage Arno162]|uniref:Uncharacterized protein n=1 Tax=Pectobacterium phage Arno162 TaxID=2500577 RepID=A0A678ZJL7_9CAUD|nr:hypothetical protein Arno162_58 [Pectobacterium phage Arno162]
MKTGIVLTLPAGDQVELELKVCEFLENFNIRTTAGDDFQAFGEIRVLQGTRLHGIQWSICEDGGVEIDCSWVEEENYVES